jgi:CheY-like chemotaxis protein/AraC-like DNA-binding protein
MAANCFLAHFDVMNTDLTKKVPSRTADLARFAGASSNWQIAPAATTNVLSKARIPGPTRDWERLAKEAEFDSVKMASLCAASERQSQRFFKRRMGCSPTQWLRRLQCRLAKELISQGYSSKAAAAELKFATEAHFCREFKKFFGVSPQNFAPSHLRCLSLSALAGNGSSTQPARYFHKTDPDADLFATIHREVGSEDLISLSLRNKRDFMQNILVVDDDPYLLELLRMSLEEKGFAVITATNGPDALKRGRQRPDLIVLDLVLPELDGFTVCQALKRDRATASIPIILMTGLASEHNRIAGLECGANDYLTKPITPDELIARMRGLLERAAGSPPARQTGPRLKTADAAT